jgi:hypothetical protein
VAAWRAWSSGWRVGAWCEGLCLFLDDGHVEIDNNVAKRSVRPLALTRKNALFAGSDVGAEHWAAIASLIETCKLIGVEPYAYLADVIARIVDSHPTTTSTSSCLGPIPPLPTSRPWPENIAYLETVRFDCSSWKCRGLPDSWNCASTVWLRLVVGQLGNANRSPNLARI